MQQEVNVKTLNLLERRKQTSLFNLSLILTESDVLLLRISVIIRNMVLCENRFGYFLCKPSSLFSIKVLVFIFIISTGLVI